MTKNKDAKIKIQLKTPTQERSRHTVSTILEACAKLLMKESFYEITTDKVAKEAGVSIGSLYQFFGNKESVVLALIKKIHSEDKINISERIKNLSHLPQEKKISRIFTIAFEVMTSNQELRHKLMSIQNYLIDSNYMAELNAYYVQLLKQELPSMPGRNVEKVAYVLVNVCFGILNTIALENPHFIRDMELIEEMRLLVSKYLDIQLSAESVTADQVKSY